MRRKLIDTHQLSVRARHHLHRNGMRQSSPHFQFTSTTTRQYANISRRPRESGNPVSFLQTPLGPRFRGNDGERISMFRNLRVEKLVDVFVRVHCPWLMTMRMTVQVVFHTVALFDSPELP